MASFTSRIRLIATYSVVLLASKAMVLAANYILALHLADEAFGYISLAQAGFVTALCVLGLSAQSAYMRYSREHAPKDIFLALRSGYMAMAALAIVASVAIAASFWADPNYIWFSMLPLAGLLASHLVAASAVARVEQNLRAYSMAEALRPLVVLLAAVWFVFARPAASAPAFYTVALLLGSGLALAMTLRALRASTKPTTTLPPATVVGFLLPLILMQFVALSNNVSDRYFLAAHVPVAEVGVYGKAYLVGSTIGTFFDSVAVLWEPYVVKHRERYAKHMHQRVRWLLLLILGGATVILTLALWLVSRPDRVFVGLDADLVAVAAIIAAAFIVRVGYQICQPVMHAFDRTKAMARIYLIGSIAGLACNALLIPWMGVYGAAIATFVSFLLVTLGAFWAVETLSQEKA